MMAVGVLIEIPEPFATQLREARVRFADPEAQTIPPHVTLVAPVSLDPAEIDAVEQHIESAVEGHQPFRMLLRGTGTFRPVTDVVFIAVAEGISGCESLESALRRGPLAVDRAYPYHPHVTVAHDLPQAALDGAFESLADYAASFTVDEVALYELDDGQWRLGRRFGLG